MLSFDAATTISATTSQTFSFQHTSGHRARAAIFLLAYDNSTTSEPFVTYGNRLMTRVTQAVVDSGEIGQSHIYFHNNIPRGTQTIAVRMNNENVGRNCKPVIVTLNSPVGVGVHARGTFVTTGAPDPMVTLHSRVPVFTVASLFTGSAHDASTLAPTNSTLLFKEQVGSQGTAFTHVTKLTTGSVTSGVLAISDEQALSVASFHELKRPTFHERRNVLGHSPPAVPGGLSIPVAMHHYTKTIGPR